jgi:tetratricopeptide (TPR) repeat protein
MENLQDLIRRARALESGGQDEGALECYVRALAAGEVDTNLLARAGVLQLRLGRVEDAAESLARASDRYAKEGLRNNALALCHRVLRADPARADFLLRMGELSAVQGYRDDALRGYTGYATQVEATDAAAAVSALRACLRHFPDAEVVKQRLAALGSEEAAPEPAPAPRAPAPAPPPAEDYLDLLTNLPGDGAEEPEGTPPARRPEVVEAEDDDPGVMPLEGLETTHSGGSWAESEARAAEDLPLLGNSFEPDPAREEGGAFVGGSAIEEGDAASHYDLGIAFKEMGLWDDAIAQLQQALRAGSNPVATLELIGECCVESGDYEQAREMLERAVSLPGTPEADLVAALYWLARSQEAIGAVEPARESYRRVLSIDAGFRDAAARSEGLS